MREEKRAGHDDHLLRLSPERLASDGSAVAAAPDGAAVFVPGLLPGETALVELTEYKKNYRRGKIQRLLSAAPERQAPVCPLFGRCGGCHLQHLSYAATLDWKRRWVEDALRRIGGVTAEVLPVYAAERPWGYRNKAVLHWDGGDLGFFAPRSRTVVPCESCALLPQAMNAALDTVKKELAGQAPGAVAIRCGAGGELACSLPGWADTLTAGVCGLVFQVGLATFLQVNPAQTEVLYNTVLEWAKLSGRETVWDLYSGAGVISLLLAARAAQVSAVEENPRAVQEAWANARRNGIDNARFFTGKTETVLSRKSFAAERPDAVVADPPRAGLAPEVTEALLTALPHRLVYVSCNPATLARDAALLSRKYRLTAVRPVDMFCWCVDVETVSLFELK
ncbi:MAG: class I SAM-dependent RNA methyltransferase [Gracilibacteraceae bacterium]|nr:class I SAM-dependent RNA methyltransferase [Gracilibacteraceae bacterium]